ncbi:hypothetical protein Agub_g2992 [Astrephomene gubernaculifera]|uniref:Uncharacterized protein n=1 Tax=Astrephomene gubernaculifera TaxID=47775 RepID=A0AAD3DK66_9CHLO|nr:hypothetical protein Agub_g2992 [Astrephomene gubernaculifera]
MQLAAAEEASRKVSLGTSPAVGQQLLSAAEVARMQRLRAEQHRRHQLSEEMRATKRLQAEMEAAGAVHHPSKKPPLQPPPSSTSSSTSLLQPQQQQPPPHTPDQQPTTLPPSSAPPTPGDPTAHPATPPTPTTAAAAAAATAAAAAASSAAASSSFQPEWRLIEGSDWLKRTRARDMFMRAVWRVVVSLRMQRRLERIKEVLAHLGYDKQRLAEEAANPVLLVSESDRPGTAPTKYLRPEMVRVRPLPLYRDVVFQVHVQLDVTHYTDFDELAPFQLKTPLEYRILGYAPEDFPGLTPYLPPLLDQPLLAGAIEEVAAAGEALVPAGLVPSLSEYPPLPDACKNMPYITLEVGNRYSEDRVFATPEPSYAMGYDKDYVMQPRLYDMYDSARHEAVASGSVRALRGGPALSDTWLVRQDTWAVQLGEEVIPRLMSGPEPEELPEDRPEDEDKPKICPHVPTDEELARYLPLTSRTEVAAEAQQPPAPDAPLRYRLVRDRHAAQLEGDKAAAHAASIAGLEQRLAEYNRLLRRPCAFALHL